ncbi:MAG: methyltransferase domain-containing protein [Thioalkalivibrio sp.]|nr:MAG: methyltransferase domain-containing protein [Thioalkalivibrio sp.]
MGGQPAQGSGVKPLQALGISLRWVSGGVGHRDCRVVPRPEPASQSPGLREWLGSAAGGCPLTRAIAPGALLPDWNEDLLRSVPGGFFRSIRGRITVQPRAGRFYPGHFLAGAPGVPEGSTAFRIAAISPDGVMTVDFNHPLAGIDLELELRVVNSDPPGSPPGDLGRAAVMNGPGMQARWRDQPTDFLHGEALARGDDGPDSAFYAVPRMVQHLDDTALDRIRHVYRGLLPKGGVVLDLMSSWTSHLDPALAPQRVAGLGMNADELAANPVLTERVVHDLNTDPRLPWPEASFDAVICTVSVEYLTSPVEVFREIRRVLRPGGRFVATFSNRWFPPKAIAVWAELHEFERMGLVLELFLRAGGFTGLGTCSLRGLPRPPGDQYADRLATSDPVYAVWGEAS